MGRDWRWCAALKKTCMVSNWLEMAVTSWVQRLLGLADLPSLAEAAGVAEADLPELAKDATRQWTGQFNPRKMTEEDFVSLYQGALEGAPALIDP